MLLSQEVSQLFEGEIKLDESPFGGRCKGKRGRGVSGNTAVFWHFKASWWDFITVVVKIQNRTLMLIITSKIKPDSILY